MKYSKTIYLFFILLILFIILFSSQSAQSSEEKTLTREMDPIVLKGEQCSDILGRPLNQYRLYAFQNDKLGPIPFQIDELDKKGHFILTHGEEKSEDEDNGRFDANDQLVFMARDAGNRLTKTDLLPEAADTYMEISITDSLTSDKGWVYLITSQETLPQSPVDYVNYEPDKMKISARNHIVQFDKRFPATAATYAFTKKIGGDETDIIDRVKARMQIKLLLTLNKTEEDVKVKELGYNDGPVRVIVRTKKTIDLFLGIPATITVGDDIYYYSYANFSFIVDLPIRPTYFHVRIYDDFSDFIGWKMYSSTNPGGHIIDGTMDKSDIKLDYSPWKWISITNGKLTFWTVALYPPDCPVHSHLYYKDDKTTKGPVEDVQGELPGLGYDFIEGWDTVDFPVEIRLLHFFTGAYKPGDEDAIVNIHDNPLELNVRQINFSE